MTSSSKFIFRTAIALLGVMLAATVLVAVNSSQRADALSGGPSAEWGKVRDYLNKYMASQYQYGTDGQPNTADDPGEGEAGFVMDQGALKGRIDSNGNINLTTGAGVLGEGDDAKSAPVLVDNYYASNNVIPGTSVRCNWNGDPAVASSCLSTDRVNAVKSRVEAHQAAGFSTDVVFYCVTGHTEAPTTGAFGYLAQTGGLGVGAYPNAPKVYAFKWGRNGWTNTAKTYSNDNTAGAAGTKSTYGYASQSQCTGGTDAELVRCIAGWAIWSSGGNVSNGVNPQTGLPNYLAGQVVDIRSGSPANTIVNSTSYPATIQISAYAVFNAGLNNLDPAGSTKIFAGRTQHLTGIVAEGARMLGYGAGFLQWGMPNWKSSMDEKWVSTGVAYPTVTATVNDVNSGLDQSAPTNSTVEAIGIIATTANIHRVANEPATMKVEFGTAPGSYTGTVNNTVLNADKTVQLTGLSPSTRYYYRVTSYDGQANGIPSQEYTFTTGANACTPAKPSLILLDPPNAFWASASDYNARVLSVSYTVKNTGGSVANNVAITGATSTWGVTLATQMPVTAGNIAAGGSAPVTLKFNVPSGVSRFRTALTGSASDQCGTGYTYP